jgi:hypothetical protein
MTPPIEEIPNIPDNLANAEDIKQQAELTNNFVAGKENPTGNPIPYASEAEIEAQVNKIKPAEDSRIAEAFARHGIEDPNIQKAITSTLEKPEYQALSGDEKLFNALINTLALEASRIYKNNQPVDDKLIEEQAEDIVKSFRSAQ